MHSLGLQIYLLLNGMLLAGCGIAVYHIAKKRLNTEEYCIKADPLRREEGGTNESLH